MHIYFWSISSTLFMNIWAFQSLERQAWPLGRGRGKFRLLKMKLTLAPHSCLSLLPRKILQTLKKEMNHVHGETVGIFKFSQKKKTKNNPYPTLGLQREMASKMELHQQSCRSENKPHLTRPLHLLLFFSCQVVLQPRGLQPARLPCPSASLRVC